MWIKIANLREFEYGTKEYFNGKEFFFDPNVDGGALDIRNLAEARYLLTLKDNRFEPDWEKNGIYWDGEGNQVGNKEVETATTNNGSASDSEVVDSDVETQEVEDPEPKRKKAGRPKGRKNKKK